MTENLLSAALEAGGAIVYGIDRRSIVLAGYLLSGGARVLGFAVLGTCGVRKTLRGLPVMDVKEIADKSVRIFMPETGESDESVSLMFVMEGFEKPLRLTEKGWNEIKKTVPVYLDFMCPGFAKCGTTTLQEVLKHNPSAYLPAAKETFFLQWQKKKGATRVLRDRHYASVKSGQMIGCIDPSHYNRAKACFDYFGRDLKLVFMLRNPAKAEFSYFKMVARYLYRPKYVDLFKKHGKYGNGMFMDYVDNFVIAGAAGHRFDYYLWISEYLKYYPWENIKIIIMEEMLKNQTETILDVERFLGLDEMRFETLPRANEGKKVSRGYLAARINYWIFERDDEQKAQMNVIMNLLFRRVLKPLLFKFTLKDNDEAITAEAEKKLIEYYRPSIEGIEDILGRSLKGIWY